MLALLVLLGVATGGGALAQLSPPRPDPGSDRLLGGIGSGPATGSSRGTARGSTPSGSSVRIPPSAGASALGGGSGTGSGQSGSGTSGSGTSGSGTSGRGSSGGGSSGSGAAAAVPLFGAGNFCAQPAGLCGPACSITCPEGSTAYCTNGQAGPTSAAGRPSAGASSVPNPGGIVGSSGTGSAMGGAGGAAGAVRPAGCAARPTCSCK